MRKILHVDVNNAFLSWFAVYQLKQGSNIDIREIPAVIGGDESKRSGIVLAKSVKAKEFGVVTGEPLYQARRKCPNLQVYTGKYKVYQQYSDKLYHLLLNYTQKVERFSIDECFLDMTDYIKDSELEKVAKEISERIVKELGFTVNIGVANNKLLAKMASDFEKPNKIHTLYQDEIEKKMWTLPISELFMVGKKTVPKLKQMGIITIRDLAKYEKGKIIQRLGKHGKLLWEYANGIDTSEVEEKAQKPKSIGNSVTLPKDLNCKNEIWEVLRTLVDGVCYRLRYYQLYTDVVNIQLRTNQFVDYSHQRKLDFQTCSTKVILKEAKKILDEMYHGEKIRLIGFRLDHVKEKEEQQLSLFQSNELGQEDILDQVIDTMKQKYGYQMIQRGGFIQKPFYNKKVEALRKRYGGIVKKK